MKNTPMSRSEITTDSHLYIKAHNSVTLPLWAALQDLGVYFEWLPRFDNYSDFYIRPLLNQATQQRLASSPADAVH